MKSLRALPPVSLIACASLFSIWNVASAQTNFIDKQYSVDVTSDIVYDLVNGQLLDLYVPTGPGVPLSIVLGIRESKVKLPKKQMR